jgi:hypothetical protein
MGKIPVLYFPSMIIMTTKLFKNQELKFKIALFTTDVNSAFIIIIIKNCWLIKEDLDCCKIGSFYGRKFLDFPLGTLWRVFSFAL